MIPDLQIPATAALFGKVGVPVFCAQGIGLHIDDSSGSAHIAHKIDSAVVRIIGDIHP